MSLMNWFEDKRRFGGLIGMVQASTLAFMTSSCDSFKKITFGRNIVQIGGEDKIEICLQNIAIPQP